jgi:hypothetical protein
MKLAGRIIPNPPRLLFAAYLRRVKDNAPHFGRF